MLARSAFERLFAAFPSGAAKRLDVYADWFKAYPVDVIDQTVEHFKGTWKKQSAPSIAEFEEQAKQIQAEGGGGAIDRVRTMSPGECRALIVKRLELTQSTSSYIPITDANIAAHWRQFASQFDWPPLDSTMKRDDERPHKIDEEEREVGRMHLALAKIGIFWCHKQLRYTARAENGCRNWSMDQCMRAIQATAAETREAWQEFGKGKKIAPPKTRPVQTDGLVPVAETLGGMF